LLPPCIEYRIANESPHGSPADPQAACARVAGRLSDLSGVGVESLEVELDQVREVFTLFLVERGKLRLPARALSEGTLRFLALCVLLEDPTLTGLICMEEPENGIHPANLPAILSLVQDLAVDPSLEPDEDNPFRQIIINTHSPGLCNSVTRTTCCWRVCAQRALGMDQWQARCISLPSGSLGALEKRRTRSRRRTLSRTSQPRQGSIETSPGSGGVVPTASALFVAEGASDALLAEIVSFLFLSRGVTLNLSTPDFGLLGKSVGHDLRSRLAVGLALLRGTTSYYRAPRPR
jgi:hypothetical protein